MKQLIERAEQLELAENIGDMNEEQLEALAQTLYEVNSVAALTLMKAIGFEDMETTLTQREGVSL